MPVSASCNPAAKVVQTLRAGSNRKSAARMPFVSGQKADKAVQIATLRSFQAGFPNTVS
jgi:hypothetical protein